MPRKPPARARRKRKKPCRTLGKWRGPTLVISGAGMSLVAKFAAMPYHLGDVATLVPAAWKPGLATFATIAAFILTALGFTTTTNDHKP